MRVSLFILSISLVFSSVYGAKKCLSPSCNQGTKFETSDETMLVFMSFSLPDSLWKEYSQYLEKNGGTFLIQGIPNGDFYAFSAKVKELRKSGVFAQIQLHPKPFLEHNIQSVPAFLVTKNEKSYLLHGAVSFDYVMKKVGAYSKK